MMVKWMVLTKIKLFKLIIILLLIICVLCIVFYKRETVYNCAQKSLIETVIRNVEQNNDIYVKKTFHFKLGEEKNYPFFCGYIVEKKLSQNKRNLYVVFSDKDINFIIVGDIIDVKNRKIIGYENIIEAEKERDSEWRSCITK